MRLLSSEPFLTAARLAYVPLTGAPAGRAASKLANPGGRQQVGGEEDTAECALLGQVGFFAS